MIKKRHIFSVFFIAVVLWFFAAFYGGISGWWVTPLASSKHHHDFYANIREMIDKEQKQDMAFVMIKDGAVFEQLFLGSDTTVNEDTLFPTASFSKWITAYSIMQMVDQGSLDLDRPVMQYIKQWKFPDSAFDTHLVTTRHLLSHTSGLSDGLGFGDYRPEETLPSLVESLNNPRSSQGDTVKLTLSSSPGEQWQYSGGGYLVLQLLIEEISGVAYKDHIKTVVFDPLDMSRSNFLFIGDNQNSAGFYGEDGTRVTPYQYAASAATGLLSSAKDLTRYVQAHISKNTLEGQLPSDAIRAMQEVHGKKWGAGIWGLGVMLYAPTQQQKFIFGHDGANDPAINTAVRINPDNGDAIIVLVSGDTTLASDIGREWVLWQTGHLDFLSINVGVKSAVMPFSIGSVVIFLLACLGLLLRIRKNRSPALE